MSLSQKTALYQEHLKNQAKMVDFHGWLLPLHYGSAIAEHQAVREHVGIFDVSHMTIIDLIGAGGRQFLRYLMTRDVDDIKHSGGASYTCMCNEQGGIIDDVLIYYRSPDNYRLVFNSSTKHRVLPWLHQHIGGFNVGIQVRHDLCMLAIQGPKAMDALLSILPPYQMDMLSTLKRFNSIEDQGFFCGRTGYTGEDGVECILNANDAITLWQKLIAHGAKPCGLAARDSLRLEAGLLLNGQDMNEQITPLQCGLDWTISWKDPTRDFIGKIVLINEQKEGVRHTLVGLSLNARTILRHAQKIFSEGKVIGEITSGIFSPTLEKSIAFARIKTNINPSQLQVEIREKRYPVDLQDRRFYISSSTKKGESS